MEKKHFVHGGDVQAISSTLPSTAKKVPNKPVAYGEKSGHLHVITGDVELFEDANGNMYACVGGEGATLQHTHESIFDNNFSSQRVYQKADHKPVKLNSNTTYRISIHKKYNPLKQFWENVKD